MNEPQSREAARPAQAPDEPSLKPASFNRVPGCTPRRCRRQRRHACIGRALLSPELCPCLCHGSMSRGARCPKAVAPSRTPRPEAAWHAVRCATQAQVMAEPDQRIGAQRSRSGWRRGISVRAVSQSLSVRQHLNRGLGWVPKRTKLRGFTTRSAATGTVALDIYSR